MMRLHSPHPLRLALISLLFSALFACKPQVEDLNLDDPNEDKPKSTITHRIWVGEPLYTYVTASGFRNDALRVFYDMLDPKAVDGIPYGYQRDRYLAIDGLGDDVRVEGLIQQRLELDYPSLAEDLKHAAFYDTRNFYKHINFYPQPTRNLPAGHTLTFTLYEMMINKDRVNAPEDVRIYPISESINMTIQTTNQAPQISYTLEIDDPLEFYSHEYVRPLQAFSIKDLRINGKQIGEGNYSDLNLRYTVLDANDQPLSSLEFLLTLIKSFDSTTGNLDVHGQLAVYAPLPGEYTLRIFSSHSALANNIDITIPIRVVDR